LNKKKTDMQAVLTTFRVHMLFYSYRIVVEVLIISCIISTYHSYLTEAMYKV